jgi:purine-nucleoside phosphorylase
MKPVHIVTDKENISPKVLMPGDPLRAKYIAENFLENPKLVNEVRNMLGYTGFYKGERITVLASGMGCPSMGIYSYELAKFYDVKKIIRIGTAGSLNPNIKIKDLVVAEDATSLSTFAISFSQDNNKVQPASKNLIDKIKNNSKTYNNVKFGHILTSDTFDVYSDITPTLKLLNFYDPEAVEMETFALYHIAKITNIEAASIVTVVDSKYDPNTIITPEERQTNLNEMIKLALDSIID